MIFPLLSSREIREAFMCTCVYYASNPITLSFCAMYSAFYVLTGQFTVKEGKLEIEYYIHYSSHLVGCEYSPG